MLLVDPKKWHDLKESAKITPYLDIVVEFLELWANLMEMRMNSQRKKVHEVAQDAAHDVLNVQAMFNGHMMGMAIEILAEHWAHGKELKKWHSSLRS